MGDDPDKVTPAAGLVRNEIAEGAFVVGGVVQAGTFTGQVHFHYRDSRAPLDLLTLRLWVDRIATDYRTLVDRDGDRAGVARVKRVDAVRAGLDDSSGASTQKDVVRRLVIAGVAAYLARARDMPRTPLPEQILLDLIVFCLWPVITAKNLPQGWQGELAEITSTRLAALVEHARATRRSGDVAAAETFARAVANRSFAEAMLTLFDDLGDPRRGGALLAAMAVAGGVPQPPTGRGKKVFVWVAGAVGGAAVLDTVLDHGSHLGQVFGAIGDLPADSLHAAGWLADFIEELFR
jgi:hypothetical protein